MIWADRYPFCVCLLGPVCFYAVLHGQNTSAADISGSLGLLAADPSAPSRWIFGEASRLCREKRGIWEDIYRRLWWPRLLSLGIIPAFWTLPIVDCTLVLWLSEQLPIYEKSSIPTSFRQRKIRHFSAGKTPFPAEKQEIPV